MIDSHEGLHGAGPPFVLSIDVEEHDRIESARGCLVSREIRQEYASRMESATHFLIDALAERGLRATFFVVGQIAQSHPQLVRRIHEMGHEVASHGWDHRRLLEMSPAEFEIDLKTSKDALQQVTGHEVVGYRAPTFSLVRSTAWAVDILADQGFRYDSSIYPVRHDRYGVVGAPARPFLIRGRACSLLEIPPATLCLGPFRVPVGGGGYFRILPGPLFRGAVRLTRWRGNAPPTVLYFHPWEFDPTQPRLPLKPLTQWRTYVGIGAGQRRIRDLIGWIGPECCVRAADLASRLNANGSGLPSFRLNPQVTSLQAGE